VGVRGSGSNFTERPRYSKEENSTLQTIHHAANVQQAAHTAVSSAAMLMEERAVAESVVLTEEPITNTSVLLVEIIDHIRKVCLIVIKCAAGTRAQRALYCMQPHSLATCSYFQVVSTFLTTLNVPWPGAPRAVHSCESFPDPCPSQFQ